MSIPSSYDWVREVKPELKNLDAIPLTGPFSFPWQELSNRLARLFEREEFVLRSEGTSWRTKEDFYQDLGPSPRSLIFSFPALKGLACWVMSESNIQLLTTHLFAKDLKSSSLQDQTFTDSFYRFLMIEVLYQLKQLSIDKALNPILTLEKDFPNQEALTIDVSIQLGNERVLGRLLLSPDLRRSWVEGLTKQHSSSPFSKEMTQAVWLTLHIEAGKTQLLPSEWSTIQLGDFLVLDSCSIADPQHLEGKILLTLEGKPAFRAKLKDNQLKILEFPLLHEVESPMAKQPEEEDEFEDLNLSAEESFEDLDEDLFEEESKESNQNSAPSSPPQSSKETQSTEAQIGLVHLEEIPMTIVVEMGQIQMNVDQLLKLEPGNLLPLQLSPEQGVHLTINGRVVAKGELIRLGDLLGVRITQLGHPPVHS